jgi:MFS transporter, SHS family, lactate transporter
MIIPSQFRALSWQQRHAFIACFLGWTLDAFDYFLLVFCLSAIAADFHCKTADVAEAIFLTLAFRPVGALLFGRLADRFGRRPILMLNICCYSGLMVACAFATSLHSLLIMRAFFGIAMGGEWGVGAALAFESLPREGRGFFSGLLQEGYAAGYLVAAAAYGGLFHFLGWRGLFLLGAAPAVLVFYIAFRVEESPAWSQSPSGARGAERASRPGMLDAFRQYGATFLFMVILMAAFTAFSHGTQDLYPTFLEKELGFRPSVVGVVGIVYNLGAISGGILFGALSETWGRKGAIITAALLTLPVIPFYALSHSVYVVAAGAFCMQFFVQGAWGVVPAYLSELSPGPVRGTFPGFAYQLGNLITSKNGVIQAHAAERFGGFGRVLSATVMIVALLLAMITSQGRESRGAELDASG